MKIGILGTGMVGQTIGERLSELGYDIMIGTRDVTKTMAQTEPTQMGFPPYSAWQKNHPKVHLASFADAAAFGEILFNCTSGMASLDMLKQTGEKNLGNKILVDVANPLDFSKGMPPTLSVSNTNSLGEQIQRAFPKLRVVKSLNTMNCYVMVNPSLVPGDHGVFVNGNDEGAKTTVKKLLQSFGWKEKHIIDLGDITASRGTEQILPLWVRLMGTLRHPMFNFNVVVGTPPTK